MRAGEPCCPQGAGAELRVSAFFLAAPASPSEAPWVTPSPTKRRLFRILHEESGPFMQTPACRVGLVGGPNNDNSLFFLQREEVGSGKAAPSAAARSSKTTARFGSVGFSSGRWSHWFTGKPAGAGRKDDRVSGAAMSRPLITSLCEQVRFPLGPPIPLAGDVMFIGNNLDESLACKTAGKGDFSVLHGAIRLPTVLNGSHSMPVTGLAN